ncbi:hypothetical protein [Bradyrhizobium sp. SZCCHNS3052]|uniref:hypothetical protein n=1 Tax=Bradyrhizobium sp. SZCCHNS3052 TaxID=3057321 RepID=UPI002916BA86|nr:hypothetical protein [Bradyrhizobium sp. SZCCHNS3052]
MVRERGNQFPTFSDVAEKLDNSRIKASIILELGHLIVRPANGVRPTIKSAVSWQKGSVFI